MQSFDPNRGSLRRPIGPLLAVGLPFVALLGLFVANDRQWESRARELEKTAAVLEQQTQQREIAQQKQSLLDTASKVAGSSWALSLVGAAETEHGLPSDVELAPVAAAAIDTLVVISASGDVRASAASTNGILRPQTPDANALRALDTVSRGGAHDIQSIDGKWLVARPIVAQLSGATLGWVLLGRSPPTDHGARTDPVPFQPRLGPFSALGWANFAAVGLVLAFALRWHLRHGFTAAARYRAMIERSGDGILSVDADSHRILFTNAAFRARLGYTRAEAKRLTLSTVFADPSVAPEALLARLRAADSGSVLTVQQRCNSGVLLDTEVRCSAFDLNGRRVLAYAAQDISLSRKAEQQLIENQQRLDRLAHYDQLTGLPNRHYLSAFLPDAIAAATASETMLGVVFLDLDRFKHINDTRGHETGDKLLQGVAQRLRACVRDSDVVVRMGGDEFVFVFRNVKSFDEITLGAARILETLNGQILVDGHALQTSGSVGVSMFPRDGANMVELLKHSDMAMYQAKDRGRNNVQLFSPILNRRLKQRVAVEASLREALRLQQLDVHYQPFVDLLTRKVVGLEALIRWRHPVHGMIPADQFIPVAEETGLVVPLGDFVLRRTLQNMSSWRAAGVGLVPVSLNVASSQLQRGDLQEAISTLLAAHGIGPELLQLEMTERAVFDSGPTQPGEHGKDTIARLRDLGIKIAIDDFGTGYSSLSYLKHWRVDALKIDRSFIRDLVTDSSDLAIVSAIIAMARQLRITVIAEGIEGYQQAELLSRLGCALGQGYLFARPMPADECLVLLRAKVVGRRGDDVEDMLATLSARG